MLKREMERKNLERGITLIALVIMIVVLLILAGVTINTLTGQNGLLTKASEAKEKTEIARIKEEADLVKLGLNMDYLANRENTERLKKNILLSALNEHFEDSTLQTNRIVTSDEKYDIIVRNNLDIVVVKHGGDYLEDGEIELSYYYDETDTDVNVIVEIYPEVGGVKSYEEFAQSVLDGLPTDETKRKEELYKIFIEADIYYCPEDYEGIENVTGTDVADSWGYDTMDKLWEGEGITEETLIEWKYVKPAEYDEKYAMDITINCSNGESQTIKTGIQSSAEFEITENGTYTFTATSTNGATGELTIEITNIVPIITSVLAERTSEGLKITVNATSASKYEFKIDNEKSVSQTGNVYNYNIDYSEAKTTSSTTDPYIPKGFTHTEGTVDTGYVISDLPKSYTLTVKAIDSIGKETSATKTITGSEFVWVPVDNDSSTVYPSLSRKITGEGVSSICTEDSGSSTDATSVQYFIDSVNTNGGFYIARYEAGMPGNISGDLPVLSSDSTARNITAIPVARENVIPWSFMDWNNAKASSEAMYNLSTDGIQSQLINSYAWDTVLNWVIASGEKTQAQVITDSTSWGNYFGSSYTFSGMYTTANLSGTKSWILDLSVRNGNNITKQVNDTTAYLLATGTLKTRNSVKNICDMAGNLEEWTTEKYSTSNRILRGWSYYRTYSSGQRASDRNSTAVTTALFDFGFRVVLCK